MSEAPQAMVIGASAGALEALSAILPQLPKGFPLAVIVVVHLPAHKPSLLPEILQRKCALPVIEAEDKIKIVPGTVYIAPADYHLLVEADHHLSLSNEEEVLFSRPSIDVLFESAADVYGEALIGIILSGANEDGAAGLRAVHQAGGQLIVQDPEFAYAAAMPKAALAACPSARVMALSDIGNQLLEMVA